MLRKLMLPVIFICAAAVMPFTSYADTSQVAIELEVRTDDSVPYMPGEYVDYTVLFKNKQEPAWLRALFEISCVGMDRELSEEDIGIAGEWVKHGDGYYYLESEAEAGTDYVLADGFRIPELGRAGKDAAVTITITGEAIDCESLEPDFSSDTPWGDEEPDTSVTVTDGQDTDQDTGSDDGSAESSAPEQETSDTASGSSGSSGTSSGSSSHSSSGSSSSSSSSSRSGSSIYLYQSPGSGAKSSSGGWECISMEDKQWKFRGSDGTYAVNGWIYVYNPYSMDGTYYSWFYFDEEGMMGHGWIRASDSVWYYTHDISDGNLGMMMTGWVDETQDGRYYYMDPETGVMLTGWQEIDGAEYYFATLDDVPAQTWFWETTLGQWIYELFGFKSYGSMYANETTPDGSTVDLHGARLKEGGAE